MIPQVTAEEVANLNLATVNQKAEQAIESLGIEPIADIEDEYGTHHLYSADEVLAALDSACIYAHQRREGFSAFAAKAGIEGNDNDEGEADEVEGEEAG